MLSFTTVRTILNRQWWNEGFSIITEANTNGGMRVSASASKNVRSIAFMTLAKFLRLLTKSWKDWSKETLIT